MNNFPKYNTKLFCEVYNNAADFLNEYKTVLLNGLYADATNRITDLNCTSLFYLLYAQYGNSPISNMDEMQFKYKLWSIIYKYGPSWEKRLDIQNKLRTMSEDDLRLGSQAIFDHATAMGDDNVLAKADPTKIDNKSGTYYTKAKVEAYTNLWEILRADVTNEFIGKFKVCFKQFVMPEGPVLYVTEENTGDDDDE